MDYTSLELLMIQALENRGVSFRSQVPTRSGFVLDFLIGDDLVIETDGPCHDGSKNKKRDRARDRILKIGGYKVHRLSYKNMQSPEEIDQWLDSVLGPLP
jgi:very-short-patch-repair endonuclease